MKKLRPIDYFTINAYWFGLAFMWNSLHPIILPAILLRFVPEQLKNTYLGGLTFLGLILAMIVQPVAGAISDRTTFRWGRRRPYILIGTLFDFVFLAVLGLAGSYWVLFAGYVLLQTSSNVAHGPAQGFIPDLVPEDRRGVAAGIKNLADMGGLVAASLIAGRLMGRQNPGVAFAIIGLLLLATLLITLFGVKEEPLVEKRAKPFDRLRTPPLAQTFAQKIRDTLRIDARRYPDYFWLIASRFLILLGIYAVQGFAQYFIGDVLNAPNPAQVTGDLLFSIGLALMVLVFPAGYLSDRIGRKRLNVFAGLLGALGIFLLLFATDYTRLMIFGSIIGAATGIFVSVNWALATDLIPRSEAGKYLGISNLATAGAGAASRLGGPLIDLFNARQPGQGYSVLFVLAGLSLLAGTALLAKVREIKVED
jgi:MFS family permease